MHVFIKYFCHHITQRKVQGMHDSTFEQVPMNPPSQSTRGQQQCFRANAKSLPLTCLHGDFLSSYMNCYLSMSCVLQMWVFGQITHKS